jgi:murein DD-endopeptidase MepM/ murein hydrolase activator NlpD
MSPVGRIATATIAVALVTSAALASNPAPAGAGKFGKRTLSKGMRGKDVRALQRHLTVLKLPTATSGRFDGRTRQNVRRYEKRRRWRADGRVQRLEAKRIKGAVRKLRARKRARRTASGAQVFPIPGPHDYGGSQARFGASRSGHSHQGQDVFAACGERLLSAQAGNVKAAGYQGSGAGHYLVVTGVDGVDYVYMHLATKSWATRGAWVYAGTQIGKVGQSGNASGCHLHFELWTPPGWYSGGAANDPLPSLLYWDSYS